MNSIQLKGKPADLVPRTLKDVSRHFNESLASLQATVDAAVQQVWSYILSKIYSRLFCKRVKLL